MHRVLRVSLVSVLALSCRSQKQSVADSDRVYFASQVGKTVMQAPGSPAPKYPQALRDAHVQGEVLAQFVVDTRGRVEPSSIEILRSPHAGLTESVLDVLPKMKFVPAQLGRRRVRQLVVQPFQFHLFCPGCPKPDSVPK